MGDVGAAAPSPPNKPLRGKVLSAGDIDRQLDVIAGHVHKAVRDPKMHQLVARILNRKCNGQWCASEKDGRAELDEIYAWVRANIRYTNDPPDLDTFRSPERTIQFRGGDCDCMAALNASLAKIAGFPARLRVIQTVGAGSWDHIYAMADAGKGFGSAQWVALDTTVPKHVGWEPPAKMIARVKDRAV